MVINGLALFAGGGGLELGLSLALGHSYRSVCYVEREAYAASTLVARMEDKALDPAPIWDDVSTFDGHPWRGKVDLISGGFPCQDISVAGRREGIVKGNRSGLWFEYARIISEIRPRYVFVENVAALTLRGLDIVLGTLSELGFDAEWITLGADNVGAPHQRNRIFIMAHAKDDHGGRGERGAEEGTRQGGGRGPSVDGSDVAHAPQRSWGQQPSQRQGRKVPGGGGEEVADADRSSGSTESELEHGKRAHLPVGGGDPVAGTHGRGLQESELCDPFPPAPNDSDRWGEVLRANPSLEPSICRVADGMASRVDRLRLCGNGVVPVVAAVAFLTLAKRLGLRGIINDTDAGGKA